jgi:hypothetical protein
MRRGKTAQADCIEITFDRLPPSRTLGKPSSGTRTSRAWQSELPATSDVTRKPSPNSSRNSIRAAWRTDDTFVAPLAMLIRGALRFIDRVSECF